MEKTSKKKLYSALVIFSLIGQIAWVVENMYFNVFIYEMFRATSGDIATMVMASAVSATLTTLLIGALSDKLGKRKAFICGGYILWGISILSFALIRVDFVGKLFPMASASALCITLVIVMDCVMTFFGSSANDACFNAWLTDVTDSSNRGKAEGINSMMPLVAILCVFGGFMSFDLSRSESWTLIFIIIGVAVVIIGAIGFFIIDDPKIETRENKSYFKNIIYGFRPSVIKKNPTLYVLFIAFAIFGISIQIFMPYLILYYTEGLKMENYVLIMAPAIILASVFTAFFGRVYDKLGFKRSIIYALCPLMLGYIVLFLSKSTALVFIGSLLMMCGYLSGMATFGAIIRDNTPQNKSGMLQGLRIVSQVLIPGVIGPAIGDMILRDAELVLNNDGTTSFIPNEKIFLGALIVLALVALALIPVFIIMNNSKKPTLCHLTTPESDNATGDEWNSVYPRPQLKRDSYIPLNGEWDFSAEGTEKSKITVPFPPESDASGIGARVGNELSYKKTFTLPKIGEGKRVILNLGAVDQNAKITVNGKLKHFQKGALTPFSVDITDVAREGENELHIIAYDDPANVLCPYGKQRKSRGGMWYTTVSGIWQSVWLEIVPENHITALKITPNENGAKIELEGIGVQSGKIAVSAPEGTLEYEIVDSVCEIVLENPRKWSPEDPYLYYLDIICGDDRVSSYFAVRTLEIKKIDGISRICLSGEPYFFHGLLDQGYYPEGIYTPISPKCIENDILLAKSLGFNTLRKHIKIEHELFYYYCDLYGMIVFQDMVNNGKYSFFHDTALPTVGFKSLKEKRVNTKTREQRDVFEGHMMLTARALYNHPCIAYWTIFNEGWGQIDSQHMYELLKKIDKTRIVDTASGWFKGADSDVESEHVYFKKVKIKPSDKPISLSEFGGYSCKIQGHSFNLDKTYGYGKFDDVKKYENALVSLYENEIIPLIKDGLCVAIYTQISDVEDETNGLITYDRRVVKVSEDKMRQIASRLKG